MKASYPYGHRQVLAKKIPDPVIVSSLSQANTYFMFRRTGVEIMFYVDNGKAFSPTHTLSIHEVNYINENIIGNAKK